MADADLWRNMFLTKEAALRYLGVIADAAVREKTAGMLGLSAEWQAAQAPEAHRTVSKAPPKVFASVPPGLPLAGPLATLQAGADAGVILLELPWGPSINHYYTVVLLPKKKAHPRDIPYRGVNIIDKVGKAFRARVCDLIAQLAAHGTVTAPTAARLRVTVDLYAPTRARIDIDNRLKALLDALTKAGVWGDDSLIDELTARRCAVVPGGRAVVRIETLTATLFEGGQ